MRILQMAGWATAAVLLGPAVLPAQSLAEVAAKEKERKKNAKPAKVFTEDDLRRAGGSSYSSPGAGVDPAPAASPAPGDAAAKDGKAKPKEKSEDDIRAEDQKAWRAKLDQARASVQRLTDLVNQMQADANDNRATLYGASRANLLTQLEDARKQLATATQAVSDAEDEGRRKGFR